MTPQEKISVAMMAVVWAWIITKFGFGAFQLIRGFIRLRKSSRWDHPLKTNEGV